MAGILVCIAWVVLPLAFALVGDYLLDPNSHFNRKDSL